MSRIDPHTFRWKRESREVNPDPFDWWQPPEVVEHWAWKWAAAVALAALVATLLWVP